MYTDQNDIPEPSFLKIAVIRADELSALSAARIIIIVLSHNILFYCIIHICTCEKRYKLRFISSLRGQVSWPHTDGFVSSFTRTTVIQNAHIMRETLKERYYTRRDNGSLGPIGQRGPAQ